MSISPISGRRILFAGGCGFIGSHLIDALLQRSDVEQIICVDNLWTGLEDNVRHVTDPRFSVVTCDIEKFQCEDRFDEVYHFASPASPPWYMSDPYRTMSANIGGAMRMLDLLAPDGKFCFASTSEVYGDPLVSPQPESYRGSVDCTGPRSSYDESKRATEALLFEMRRTRGTDIRVVRLFNVFGPRTRPDDGRAVSNFITQALAGRPLTIYGDGLQSRSWGYIDDIVEGLARYFWRDKIDYPGPLNIGNDREVSVIDVARYVSQVMGGCPIQHEAPVPQDPTNRCPDLTLARDLLPGWECKVDYEEGVRRTIDWFREETGRPAPRITLVS
ncbi:UDP-glucose 4-epimerase [Novosphingobium marinum]|uniref:UDP-glucose 4-epimerase/UDP-glucuronate decarboxylase n=1 Tax=Novosphingobium marinum TaxID=1514948 RepID=A0A7Y9XXX0_9SPHN|nr:NAD-dependent epimerase/dehydratase family protein [Novosphingobium marinum]NYH95385.1 UDP-glucose 4-epimerase/UDP-glucuronate decarboxylase [Novosphingobium marinum]GGC26642.1 UDP-glucose 4-epimerase [Novosphingobium marinum]